MISQFDGSIDDINNFQVYTILLFNISFIKIQIPKPFTPSNVMLHSKVGFYKLSGFSS